LWVVFSTPGRGCRSRIATERPVAAISAAAARPVTPPPMTRTSRTSVAAAAMKAAAYLSRGSLPAGADDAPAGRSRARQKWRSCGHRDPVHDPPCQRTAVVLPDEIRSAIAVEVGNAHHLPPGIGHAIRC